ncbi:UDP-N-acetylglucosamine 1-carboxyvinyltransferase [Pullulanibacillus pueri]|uniref:UDP-N-acetylglucosamine 1-carboxyvinyltransferase n=1 Tax=Pullulanibacillus pueri TaxID=1437324 RepID=A0A8J2ZXM1_9BACL|nr:UDP-N-acetylglucosamine 1-carboxyvinyltransferase [Pullulanibacillus pueri]MBM7680634.1 UDP-N-acetylglucosamine 1-carboxyvinyltransferase [Pullulanibacillus pueri]GGH83878.1 UDP-N-acetylglucosamine 1-carboxyvinyltransferase 2 [Pullulanibacillus pueri]
MKEKYIVVKKSDPLQGSLAVPGSKNAVLGLLAAALMTDEDVKIENIPQILDVKVLCEIVADIGVDVHETDHQLIFNAKNIKHAELNTALTSKFRASYYFIGALISKYKKVKIGYPGGDDFGSRPIDQHEKGLTALGATFNYYKDYYTVEAERLKGADIYFDVITSGATINVMLASVFAEGKTTLTNAARDPEVVDVANLLNKMGANIRGAGTSKIIIHGVNTLKGCDYQTIPDRLIAGTFLIAAGVTGGQVTVRDVIPEHLTSLLEKLTEMGMTFEVGNNSITAYGDHNLKATRVKTGMYPLFATDLQQPLTSLMLKASGKSIVTDPIFPNRFRHIHQLSKLGAVIEKRKASVFIPGNQKLKGARVEALDVRAGSSLILAGLMAEGTTIITDIDHILRGYENVTSLFAKLGADITLENGSADKSLHHVSKII